MLKCMRSTLALEHLAGGWSQLWPEVEPPVLLPSYLRGMANSSFALQPTWADSKTSKALNYEMEGEEKYYLEATALSCSRFMCLHWCAANLLSAQTEQSAL